MEDQIRHYQNKLAFEMDPSDLFDALNNNEAVVVVDTRKKVGFLKEHIPGAINLPHREMNEASLKDLDHTKLYVCYCNSIGCNASTRGSLNMTKLGFTVRELIGGLEWWKLDGYATEGEGATVGLALTCAC